MSVSNKYKAKKIKQPLSKKMILHKIRYKIFGYNILTGLASKIVTYTILISISYVFLFPLLKMISTSTMSPNDIINPEVDWIPENLSFSNFKTAYIVLGMPKTLFNSIWYSGVLAIFQTVVSALTGFAFARYEFKLKKFWFSMVLLSFIIPLPVVLIPRIMIFTSVQSSTGLQLIGTIIPQLVMALFGQGVNSAILILIFYNFFKLIPPALDEAAHIDGASAFQVFWHIIVKLSIPSIVTVFLFAFVWNWNETYTTSTFLRGAIKLLPIQLSVFENIFGDLAPNIPGQANVNRINEAYKMAATLISMVPLLITYIFAQKQFIAGIENTGIK
ncbi:MAG: carbohydrate ABC transporter permease [Clostridiaceae bacterium]|nr:carbohydrate ABC transporter permease [Clostridiaceae bacterium]